MTVGWEENSVEKEYENKHKMGIEENERLLKFVYRMFPSAFPSESDIFEYRVILARYELEYKKNINKLSRVREFLSVLDVLEEFIANINKKQ